MKKLFLSILCFTSFIAYSQTGNVGINTTDPKITLDITGQPSVASKADGVLVPRMKRSELIAKVAANTYTAAAHNGTLIFITDIDGTTTAATAGITTANSFYYLDSSTWKPFVGSSSTGVDATNDAFVNNSNFTRVELGTQSDASTARTAGTEFVIKDDGKVGIGNPAPNYKVDVVSDTPSYLKLTNSDDSKNFHVQTDGMGNTVRIGTTSTDTKLTISAGGTEAIFVETDRRVSIGSDMTDKTAVLDVKANDKGILIPRINLTSNTLDLNGDGDNSVANQAIGLLIFNSGTILPKGFYYWNGTEWRSIDDSTAIAPTVSSINCNGAILNPKSYTSGTPFSGTLTVPYSGGNGGSYSNGTNVYTSNGLNFLLQGGKLNVGSGNLVFIVSGMPTVSSPTATSVTINNTYVPFLTAAQNCSASVGNSSNAEILETAVMGPLVQMNDPRTGYGLMATTPDGKYSVRVWDIFGGIPGNVSVQIRPNTTLSSLSWNHDAKYYNNSGAGAILVYAKNIATFPTTALGKWCGTTNTGTNNFSLQGSSTSDFVNPWGDFGIADGSNIEHRRYTWTNVDPNDKTMYQAEIMMGLFNNSLLNSTNCPSGVCNFTKAYIKITQVSAN